MPISLVVAVAENGVIGRDNALPWHLPDDLRYFKDVTMGHPIVMGRRTFLSIGRPLPGRHNIVLTRDPFWQAEGVTTVHGLREALQVARGDAQDEPEIMIIGGADIFALALPLASTLYLTEVKGTPEGDTYFPPLDDGDWQEVERRPGAPAADDTHTHDYVVLKRHPVTT